MGRTEGKGADRWRAEKFMFKDKAGTYHPRLGVSELLIRLVFIYVQNGLHVWGAERRPSKRCARPTQ